MSIITPEMVEAGARAIYDKKPWAMSVQRYEELARACLESALPLILERAAKEAEPQHRTTWGDAYWLGRADAAIAIRSLQTKDNA